MSLLKLGDFSCFVLHDVDMIPETDLAAYHCPPTGQASSTNNKVLILNFSMFSKFLKPSLNVLKVQSSLSLSLSLSGLPRQIYWIFPSLKGFGKQM